MKTRKYHQLETPLVKSNYTRCIHRLQSGFLYSVSLLSCVQYVHTRFFNLPNQLLHARNVVWPMEVPSVNENSGSVHLLVNFFIHWEHPRIQTHTTTTYMCKWQQEKHVVRHAHSEQWTWNSWNHLLESLVQCQWYKCCSTTKWVTHSHNMVKVTSLLQCGQHANCTRDTIV